MKVNHVNFISGGVELLERLEPLWKELNDHHVMLSTYFSDEFEKLSFETRRSGIENKSYKKEILVEIVENSDLELDIGYCVSTVNSELQGSIDSIFVKQEFRKQGIASALMFRAIRWLDANNIKSKSIGVVYGNEQTFTFYRKFGFYPRLTYLSQRKD